ncbi:hypothetical protein MHU86_11663 [Fragilaria crotonensis]|nr:hypothetical protein MHU86_11663 [Fragilaria crotonensis]
MDAKLGQKHAYGNPPSLPSTIKVGKSSDSQLTSSVPGLSSIVDMSMTENTEENQISVIKTCIKKHVFSIWKFYQKDYHSHFSEDEKTLCGFIMKHTNIRGTENWWLGMRRIVVKTHTDLEQCNKNMQTKFKGEELKGFTSNLGTYEHSLYSGSEEETSYLLKMRDNICYYAQIIDTYAPCIVGSKWNNTINMENHCATTDRKVWSKKILSISDEAFILLCLINYGKRWFAELVKTEKMRIGTWTDEDNNNLPPPLYTFSRNKGAHDNGEAVVGHRWKEAASLEASVHPLRQHGALKKHASTVPLVLNPETGYITPQYHIVFDDWFATVATNVDALPDFNTTRWARLFGDSRYQFPFDDDDDNDATEEARMDSQATEAINENQTRVAASMDEAVAIEQLPVPPLAEAPPRTPTVQQPLPSSPLLTPRPPTPLMSQTREQSIDLRSLQSPPTPDIRTSSLQRRPHSSSQAKEATPRKVPATPISPVHQPIFSPVLEQTPMSEARRVLFQTMHSPLTHHVTSNQSSRLRHQRLRAGPTAFAPSKRLGYDNTQGHGYGFSKCLDL